MNKKIKSAVAINSSLVLLDMHMFSIIIILVGYILEATVYTTKVLWRLSSSELKCRLVWKLYLRLSARF